MFQGKGPLATACLLLSWSTHLKSFYSPNLSTEAVWVLIRFMIIKHHVRFCIHCELSKRVRANVHLFLILCMVRHGSKCAPRYGVDCVCSLYFGFAVSWLGVLFERPLGLQNVLCNTIPGVPRGTQRC